MEMRRLVGFASADKEDANHGLGMGMDADDDDCHESLTLKKLEA